ncbi:MAG: hypothetical protein C3F02_00500 [Parcubacteria group bacterium]|nr:MAG: hypothetical protein C3F02_00500 [Parcubacteria group bacterium]
MTGRRKVTNNRIFAIIVLFLLFFLFVQPIFATESGHYENVTTDQTKYIDKYFEIDKDGNFKVNIYIGDQKISTVSNTSTQYDINDHLGSPTIITDSQGNILETNDYDPYGQAKTLNSTIDNTKKFTGKELDKENNLQYYGARYLDNTTGRFYSIDPALFILNDDQDFTKAYGRSVQEQLANPQNLNSYSYAGDNPVKYTDPDGKFYGQFGVDMASGQRDISSFLHNAANYTCNQGGTVSKASGFVTNSLGDFVDNVANLYDPEQKTNTRLFSLLLTTLDTSVGGEEKVIGKSLETADKTFISAARHALEQGHFKGKTIEEVTDITKDTFKNFDIKATIKGVKKYFYNIKDNILFIDNPKQPTVFQPDKAYKYVKENILGDFFKK